MFQKSQSTEKKAEQKHNYITALANTPPMGPDPIRDDGVSVGVADEELQREGTEPAPPPRTKKGGAWFDGKG